MDKVTYDPYADFELIKLANGLSIYYSHWDRPWFSAHFIVHGGSREDLPTKQGTAHFVEHLVSESVPNMSSTDIRQYFESAGGYAGLGGTSYLATRYSFVIPVDIEILKKSLDIFSSMLMTATLGNNIERERNVILREFHQYYPIRKKLEWEMEPYKHLFPNHRLATFSQPLGWPEHISATTLEDLQSFYNTYYVPANMSIVVAGGISKQQFLDVLSETSFTAHKEGQKNAAPSVLPVLAQEGKKIAFSQGEYLKESVDKADFTILWKTPADLSRHHTRFLRFMLYDILDEEIRQKRGWSYGAGVGFDFFQDVATFVIDGSFGVEAVKELPTIVHQAISSLPTNQKLFEHEKNMMLKRFTMYDELGTTVAKNVSNDLVEGEKIYTLTEAYDAIQNTTLDDVVKILTYLSPDKGFELTINP